MPAELAVPEETSALRHLHAAPTTFDLPAAFPNVTHLKADCTAIEPENKYASILRFSNIESLNLRIQPFAFTLNSFLEAYGGNLHTLMIESKDWLNFSFSRIFDACPKLRKIELGHILILDDMKPLESFAQLRELHWKPKNQFEMTNILSAPNLERVYLSCRHDWISVENLRKLMSLVADKKILSKLTSFSLRLFGSINYREINYDLLRALRDFVAVAAVHLPKLVNFKFWLGIKGRHPRLPRYFQSDNPEELGKIGTKFQEWIGDDTIVEFIRAINVRKQL
ncbi:Hypothetical predicted protein [Cloeon dipterum]|uniref:F-box domain-containing protein n=1 Tax=Cloeon dipterum TaxID=197152 RepID=A0A8S1CE41_9INSE|nr:Hypothetical predicted protein [Cloeon dipterum]